MAPSQSPYETQQRQERYDELKTYIETNVPALSASKPNCAEVFSHAYPPERIATSDPSYVSNGRAHPLGVDMEQAAKLVSELQSNTPEDRSAALRWLIEEESDAKTRMAERRQNWNSVRSGSQGIVRAPGQSPAGEAEAQLYQTAQHVYFVARTAKFEQQAGMQAASLSAEQYTQMQTGSDVMLNTLRATNRMPKTVEYLDSAYASQIKGARNWEVAAQASSRGRNRDLQQLTANAGNALLAGYKLDAAVRERAYLEELVRTDIVRLQNELATTPPAEKSKPAGQLNIAYAAAREMGLVG